MKNIIQFIIIASLLNACGFASTTTPLPFIKKMEQDFLFVNQDSQQVTPKTIKDKVYVTDFFFTTCPTICPKMKTQMVRIYEAYENHPDFVLLSHSIDTKHDSVAVLKQFAEGLGISTEKWHLVTGERDSIYSMAKHYMVSALEDENEPGGYIHSGAFCLVDQDRYIRGYYDGTDPEDVDKLIADLDKLLDDVE